jgi:peroxiredoxin
MKTKLMFVAAMLLSALCSFAQVKIGEPAPDFEGKDINGKTHKLSDLKGKIVVLESINLDCPYVANHYKSGAMQELQSEVTGKGAVWFAVNSIGSNHKSHRAIEDAKKEVAEHKIKATAYIDDSDGKIGKAYGLKTTPHMIVIDKEGKVAYQGAIDNKAATEGDPRKARNYVREAVNKLAAGEQPDVPETKPYGCGIKYR